MLYRETGLLEGEEPKDRVVGLRISANTSPDEMFLHRPKYCWKSWPGCCGHLTRAWEPTLAKKDWDGGGVAEEEMGNAVRGEEVGNTIRQENESNQKDTASPCNKY